VGLDEGWGTELLKKLNAASLCPTRLKKLWTRSLKRAERLRQSTLKRAFEGTLRSTQIPLRGTSDIFRTLGEMCLKIIEIGGKCYG